MTNTRSLEETDEAEIQELLTGRRIVAAEMGAFDCRDKHGWKTQASGRLTLDNGTRIYVVPNSGGCSCGSGDYELTSLAAVDNVITSVRLAEEHDERSYEAISYRIYVVADAVEINAVQVNGDDGNGYYGTGYELIVVPEE